MARHRSFRVRRSPWPQFAPQATHKASSKDSADYFDGDVFYSKHLPGCGDSMMPVNQIIIVVDVADHTDRRKFFAALQGAQVVLYYIGL